VEDWPAERVRAKLSRSGTTSCRCGALLSPTRDAVRGVFDDRVDARRGEAELSDRAVELHFIDAHEKLMRASEALDLTRDLVAGVRDLPPGEGLQ